MMSVRGARRRGRTLAALPGRIRPALGGLIRPALGGRSAVAAVGVVAWPDEKWGETPCAFIELKPGVEASEDDMIQHCRDNLAHFKCPRHIVFGPLPKTSTGKIQKFKLRDQANELASAAQ